MTTFTGKLKLFCLVLPLFYCLSSSAQFATLVELIHDCGEGGYVEFELNGDPSSYTYYWEHGPETLILNRLQPGEYTLVVRNQFGCVERYDIRILSLDSCFVNTFLTYSPDDPCIGYINIEVFSGDSTLIDEAALNIVWDDGNPSGLIRQYFLGQLDTFCVTITLVGDDSLNCCYIYECIPISRGPACEDHCDRRMIVNETNREPDGKGQFVELLVIGGCNCERRTDIRGYILDDNNGYLIPANSFVNFYNLEQTIGVNPGYLVFNYSENWDSVPNGSLILIYDQRDTSVMTLPADDPTDANQDGVYVLQADDTDYFYAKSGSWNATDQMMEYSGMLSTAEWERIAISPIADGIQIRDTIGTYHHGVSLGTTSSSAANNFPLWITSAYSTSHNIQLTGPDYANKLDYTYTVAESSTRTPGLPNSTPNQVLIDSLKDCGQSQSLVETNINSLKSNEITTFQDILKEESVHAYPNPFTNEINITFHSTQAGEARMRILSVSGQLISSTSIQAMGEENHYLLNIDRTLPSGLIILEFKFPSGKKEYLKMTHLQMH